MTTKNDETNDDTKKLRSEMTRLVGDGPDLIERVSALAEQPTQAGDLAANLLVQWDFWVRHAAHIRAYQTDGYAQMLREQRYARASAEIRAAA